MVETQTVVASPAARREWERGSALPLILQERPAVSDPLPPDPYANRPSRTSNKSSHWLSRSEKTVLSVAVGCTATVCCLLLIYLAAYAQVTKLGIAQANMRLALRQERIENAILGAQYDWLRSPRRISDAAANFKMARDAERTVYITGAQPGPTVSDATVQADNDLPAIPVTITQVGTIAAGVRDVKLPGVSNGGIDSQTSHGAATAD